MHGRLDRLLPLPAPASSPQGIAGAATSLRKPAPLPGSDGQQQPPAADHQGDSAAAQRASTGDQRVALGGEHALLQRYDPWAGAVAL